MKARLLMRSDWESLSEEEKNDLMYLRFSREILAKEILSSLDVEEGIGLKWLDELCLFTNPNSGYERIRIHLLERNRFTTLEYVEVLKAVAFRVARLEREACKVHVGSSLANA